MQLGLVVVFLILFGCYIYTHLPTGESDRRLDQQIKTIYANMEFSAVYQYMYYSPVGHGMNFAICKLDSFKYLGNDVEPLWPHAEKYLAEKFSYVPESDVLFNDTIIAVIFNGNPKESMRIYTYLGDSTLHFE